MMYEPIPAESVKKKAYKPTKLFRLLTEFYESPAEAAEVRVEEGEYSSLYSAQSALRLAIKHYGLPLIAMVRDGHLYLIKQALLEVK